MDTKLRLVIQREQTEAAYYAYLARFDFDVSRDLLASKNHQTTSAIVAARARRLMGLEV